MSPSKVAPRRSRRLHTSGTILAAAGLLVIAFATLRPGGPRFRPAPGWTCLICGATGGVDIALNIFLFIPLGVGLRLRGASIRRAVATAFLVSLSVELWQNFVVSGRDPSISDVLTNTTGGALGATITTFAGLWLFPTARRATALALAGLAMLAVILTATAVGLQPSIEPRLYYAQIEPRDGNPGPFSGRLLSTAVNGRPVLYEGELQDPDSTPWPVFTDGRLQLDVALVPGPRLVRAPIVRITNSRWEAAALLQERDALVFRARTRARDARLVTPGLAMNGVLPRTPVASPDTLHVHALLERHGLRVDLTRAGKEESFQLPFRVALGWFFVLPYFTPAHQYVIWLSAGWLAALLVPIGFWSARAPLGVGVAVLAAAVGLLILLPLIAHLSSTAPLEWAGVALGFVGGVYLARLADSRVGHRVASRARTGGLADVSEIVPDPLPSRRT